MWSAVPGGTRGHRFTCRAVLVRVLLIILAIGFIVHILQNSKYRIQKPNFFVNLEPVNNRPSLAAIPGSRARVERHEKWIVVTSIFYPTEQLRKLNQIPGWKLVVVADKKTPVNWKLDNAVFLDIVTQQNLDYEILKFVPWNSYTRKAIGYLYAIENGAKFIYDTDDDNAPNDLSTFETNFVFSKTTRGLVTGNGKSAANPYAHFGQKTAWPRGYPLDRISEFLNNTYTTCRMHTPIIQQGLVNGDPDVDAIFRMTRKFSKSLNITFDGSAPPIIYPQSVLAPFNSQNTLFHYNAFWSLLFPVSVAFRVTDIWRSYWAQPLLWKIGGHLGFYPPHTTQIRNSHVYLNDFGDEDKMYKQSGDLVKFLSNWECSDRTESLYKCMLELTAKMVDRNFWGKSELDLIEAWVSDLKRVGYIEPPFQNRSPCLSDSDKSVAMFNGVNTAAPVDRYRSALRSFCNTTMDTAPQAPLRFSETLLVVTFNFPHYENIWLLDLIYRPHYPNIVYCGSMSNFSALNDLISSPKYVSAGVKEFTFVRALNIESGYHLYECALRAIDMKYSVNGYLIVSDDILLNFWNIPKFNHAEMWVQNQIDYLDTNVSLAVQEPGLVNWPHWAGQNETTQLALKAIRTSDNPLVKEFRANLKQNGIGSTLIGRAESDFFYVPTTKQEIYYEVGTLIFRAGMFLELATPLLAAGLSSPTKMVRVHGVSLWDESLRSNPFSVFNVSKVFLHPVKLSRVMADLNFRQKYCTIYVQQVLKY